MLCDNSIQYRHTLCMPQCCGWPVNARRFERNAALCMISCSPSFAISCISQSGETWLVEGSTMAMAAKPCRIHTDIQEYTAGGLDNNTRSHRCSVLYNLTREATVVGQAYALPAQKSCFPASDLHTQACLLLGSRQQEPPTQHTRKQGAAPADLQPQPAHTTNTRMHTCRGFTAAEASV